VSEPEPTAPQRRGCIRALSRWAGSLAILYGGVILVFWFLERHLVFRPCSPARSWDAPVDSDTQDVNLVSVDGVRIHAWWLPPRERSAGAILIAHGNGGNLSHRGQLAADLRRTTGAGVLIFDYPGYGKSEGQPTEATCYDSAEAAFHWLTDEAKIPANRIVLLGESLGGGVAVELATRHDHRALVLLYTFTSLPAAAKYHYPFLPVYTLMRTRFDNLTKITQCRRPVLIVHGTADGVIPFTQSEQLFAAANEPKEFLRLEGIGHDLELGDLVCVPLAKFLARHAP
jgi:fermentation-respiration switch protein FrsA (DUF1100 family)